MLMEKLKRLPEPRECIVTTGGLSSGIEYPALRLAVLTDTQLMSAGLRRQKRRKKAVGEKISSCADLAVGDLVVHEQHGIGRFAGVVRMPVDGAEKDYMKISYAGTDSLYVPATQLDLVTKYVGAGEDTPVRLSKLGGAEWQRTKSRAKAAAKQLAKGLIQLYAERARTEGHAFAPDSPWQLEFEERFGYEETEDQLRCVEEIKRDMEKPMPMDRPALRRCWLRQDGGRAPRRDEVHTGRLPSGDIGVDDGPGPAALPDGDAALLRLPGEHRGTQPFSDSCAGAADAQRPKERQMRPGHRHAQTAAEGYRVQEAGPAHS